MLDIIKKASLGAVSSTNPVTLSYGTVLGTSPLRIEVDQRLVLSGPALVVPESMTAAFLDGGGEGTAITLRKGLEAGDRVLLLRIQGGQSYIVMDRLVSTL